MKLVVVLSSNDSETVWNAFRFANTGLARADAVQVFLLGKGVEAGLAGTLQFDIQEQIALFRSRGGALIGCGVCCESRRDEMPSLVSSLACEMGSMNQLHELIAQADKVLSF
ncbi:MAG: DsrE family protein [Burkholderiales bacterium]|nr:DsrE family protein [Burkholderiales bacterium]MDE2396432.1 DsrE family protein [Burkholderiales bacterium]MDE2452859.1 DsrE family protein [Burkholderiales bacterium]